eukprot:1399330-Rhodomonas_salina.1
MGALSLSVEPGLEASLCVCTVAPIPRSQQQGSYGCSPLLGGPSLGFKLFVGHAGAHQLLLFIVLLVCEVGGVSSLRLLYQRGLVLGGCTWYDVGRTQLPVLHPRPFMNWPRLVCLLSRECELPTPLVLAWAGTWGCTGYNVGRTRLCCTLGLLWVVA